MKNILFTLFVLSLTFVFLQFACTVLVPIFIVIALLDSMKSDMVELLVAVVGSSIMGIVANIVAYNLMPELLTELSSQFQIGGETYNYIMNLIINNI